MSLDTRRYVTRPKARFHDAAGTGQIWMKHKLDRLLPSAGIVSRFQRRSSSG